MKEMFVSHVGIATTGHPVVLLSEENGESEKALPIFIGSIEAAAISSALLKTKPHRPLTHDLLGQVITALGGKIDRLEICRLSEQTYHGTLVLDSPQGEINIDCRPSDGIALALRSDARILVDNLLAESGMVSLFTADQAEQDELQQETKESDENFRKFLSNLKASDFTLPRDQSDPPGA